MKIKIPSSINICGLPYKIIQTDDKKNVSNGNGDSWGHIYYERLEIWIYNKLSIRKKWNILLHEIIHGIDESCSIGLNESKTDRLAVGLMDVLVRNKIISL